MPPRTYYLLFSRIDSLFLLGVTCAHYYWRGLRLGHPSRYWPDNLFIRYIH
ncbi:MAG: hypothetical protein GPOALKHO_001222 [Sodalis sp.]|nr:MAG: hypothetical protein GPOALKHO_001222 [Sodalis sp.]